MRRRSRKQSTKSGMQVLTSNSAKAFFLSTFPHSKRMSHTGVKKRLRGVVFDMDGTLTVPVIDFPAMYRAVLGDEEYRRIKAENPSGIDILGQIEAWPPHKQRKAYETIAEHERQGSDRLQIMPGSLQFLFLSLSFFLTRYLSCHNFHTGPAGAAELCALLDSKKIRRGLITRNVMSAVDLFHERFGIMFSPALSREFRPYKPDPAPLLHICSIWEVQPNEVIMIGDSLKDDVSDSFPDNVACGGRAGAFTCLLDQTGRYDSPEYADVEFKPDFKVTSLADVFSVLEGNFDLSP
ncbi:Haloacid dehalogenase-like hydrolase domain-containing protein, partial [Mucuna pruriens]